MEGCPGCDDGDTRKWFIQLKFYHSRVRMGQVREHGDSQVATGGVASKQDLTRDGGGSSLGYTVMPRRPG
jgi:hypothetical protein